MDLSNLVQKATDLKTQAEGIALSAKKLSNELARAVSTQDAIQLDPFVTALTVFILACVIGYYVVWNVTSSLHSPLMAVTNAISSVIIIGALLAAGASNHLSTTYGLIAVFLASINIFGGFIVTQRMLAMFSNKKG